VDTDRWGSVVVEHPEGVSIRGIRGRQVFEGSRESSSNLLVMSSYHNEVVKRRMKVETDPKNWTGNGDPTELKNVRRTWKY
jgi:hypothetical protein